MIIRIYLLKWLISSEIYLTGSRICIFYKLMTLSDSDAGYLETVISMEDQQTMAHLPESVHQWFLYDLFLKMSFVVYWHILNCT
jgi:hypothetical protein